MTRMTRTVTHMARWLKCKPLRKDVRAWRGLGTTRTNAIPMTFTVTQ